MEDLLPMLSVYYQCTAMAEAHVLTQIERFACNETYQQVKRLFLDGDLAQPGSVLTRAQNTEAYLLFKSWEVENVGLVEQLKAQ